MANTTDMSPEDNIEALFPWYASTGGPGISRTITNIGLTFVPVANLVLASLGFNVLPEQVNLVASIAVFVFFAVRAVINYVRAKRILGARLAAVQTQLRVMQRRLEPVNRSSGGASTTHLPLSP